MSGRTRLLHLLLSLLFLSCFLSAAYGRGSSEQKRLDVSSFKIEKQFNQGEARLKLALTSDSITTAERLGIRLTVTLPAGGEAAYPPFEERLGEFTVDEFSESYPKLLKNDLVVYEKTVICRPFLPGTYTIPGFTVPYSLLDGREGTFMVPPQKVDVRSVLPGDGETQTILDIVEPGAGRGAVPAFIITSVVLLAAGVFLHRRFRRNRRKGGAVPVPDPCRTAEEGIEELLRQLRSGGRAGYEVYASLSDILRRYVEDRYGFHAPEQTTEEFLAVLSGSDTIHSGHKQLLRQFLSKSDLVKFAGYLPMDDEIYTAAETLRNFVHLTGEAAEHRSKENGEDGCM